MSRTQKSLSYLAKKYQLTASQAQCAEILVFNVEKKSIEEIAEELGVSSRTIYRWKKEPNFIDFKNEIAEQAMEEVVSDAYLKLQRLMAEGKSEKIQLEAIKLILQNRGRLKQDHEHTVEVKHTKSLDELEKEVLEMERDLLPEDTQDTH